MNENKLSGFTPFPNLLIDQLMPTLRDTEWRILCVVTRQTLGWFVADTQQRKEVDWLSQSQLSARTGRASAALSQALARLVRLRLIVVTSAAGLPLNTAAQRRRAMRLYYRLHPRLYTAKPSAYSHFRHRKANTTKHNIY